MSAIPAAEILAVTKPLRAVARRRRVLHSMTGVLQLLIVALTVVLAAALVAGWMDDPRKSVRWGLSLVAELTLLFALVSCLAPAFRRHRLKSIAREIEPSLPGSNELISSAVELSAERDARYAASPELVRHVVSQAAAHAKSIDPAAVVPLRNVPWWLLALMPVVFCWALMMTVMPLPTRRGLYTIAFPWRPTPASLLPVTVDPGHITRAAGESLQITAKVAPRVRSKPRVERATMEMEYATGQKAAVDMTRTATRAFETTIEKLVSDFKYRIVTEDGSSRWFIVTVMQRPVVTSVDVHYAFPAYTKLPPKDDPRKDGTVDALVGAEVTLTLHTSQPLLTLPEKSRLVIAEKTDAQRVNIEAAPNSTDKDPAYLAKFFVTRSAPYRADIQNTNYLQATDEPERQITAREDEPPKVSITSPQQKVTAALDDTVPVKFTASDDYGLSKIEMFVQVEGQQPEMIDVPFNAGDNSVSQTWPLKIGDVLARKNLKDTNRIEYQLRVTDTRDPGPQVAQTQRYVVEIDHSNRSASQRDAAAQKQLEKALKQAIDELKEERQWLQPMAERAKERAFNAEQRKVAAGTKESLLETAKELQKAAEAAAEPKSDTPVAELAKSAEQVAQDQVEPAAEKVAAATTVDADQPADRQQDLQAAVAQVDKAEAALEKLLDQLKNDVPKQAMARDVAEMAAKQEKVADELTKANDPANRRDQGQALREQQELRQRLEEMVNQNKDLNDPAARESAERNQQLVRRVEQLQEQQKRMDGLAQKQQAANDAQAKVNEFAQKQKELNKRIDQFAKADESPLKGAQAKAPEQAKLDNAVKNLENPNNAPQGNQQQREIANELRQDAQRLDQSAKRDDAAPGRRQQQARQDEKRAEEAKKESAQVEKQAKSAEEKKDANAQAQAKQKQQQLAQRLDQQANEMKARATSEAAKKSADEAKADVAEARQAAEEGDASEAAEDLAKAADALEAAAKAEESAAGEERKAMAAAANDANALADAQQKLADETAKATQAQAQARAQQGDPNALERGEQQAANEANQTAAEASRAEQQDRQQKNDAMAARAAAAQQALKEAAQHEQSAAQAAHDHDAGKAGAEQQAAAQSLAKANQALRGDGQPQQGQPGSPQDQARDLASAMQEARQAQADAMGNKPEAAQQAARALDRASQQLQQAVAKSASGQPQVAKATQPPQKPSDAPSQQTESHQGAGPQEGVADQRPESVKQVGISAGDWAKLPPLTQQQLLNASQQAGPPEYREQIKRYFVKIAKLQADEGGRK